MTKIQKILLAAIVKSLLRGKSLIQIILAYWVNPLMVKASKARPSKTLSEFLREAEAALVGPVNGEGLQQLSTALKKQFIERLQKDEQCMLPSYSHQLPLGDERGEYVALDVGGSTLRVAVVALRGREEKIDRQSEIISMHHYRIGKNVKALKGMAFFNWMAQRIADTLAETGHHQHNIRKPLPLACAWSFPIEYVENSHQKIMPLFDHI